MVKVVVAVKLMKDGINNVEIKTTTKTIKIMVLGNVMTSKGEGDGNDNGNGHNNNNNNSNGNGSGIGDSGSNITVVRHDRFELRSIPRHLRRL